MPIGNDADCNDDVVMNLRHVAFTEARRINLGEDDAHDCAMEMVLHALMQAAGCATAIITGNIESLDGIGDANLGLLPAVSVALIATHLVLRADLRPDHTNRWLRRCARNFALNYRRSLNARCRHEVEPKRRKAGVDCEDEVVPLAPPAEYDALNRLLHQDVFAAMQKLPPHAQDVFDRFHLQGESLAEIALSSGKSTNAVKKCLHRTRHHVRTALAQQGYAEMSNNDEA